MLPPPDPVAAVTHPDPYPYYAELVAHRPLYRDEALGLWVASSAAAATAVLTSELCRVRPLAEPVPRALLGSPAADIFRRLVRMNDGAGHGALKSAVSMTVDAIAGRRAIEESERWARALAPGMDPATFSFQLSAHVIGTLVGVPASSLPDVARWTGELVAGFAPGSRSEPVERGKAAAGCLLALFRSLRAAGRGRSGEGLLAVLAQHAERAGQVDADAAVANGIGLLSQAYEATAGLIGNALVTLAAHPPVRAEVASDPGLLPHVIQEVLRFDSPVQNTRRFLAGAATIAGQAMDEGDAVLVVLAAANRDPSANPDPDRFDPRRAAPRVFSFGAGVHACPGQALATAIAAAGVAELQRQGIDLERLAGRVTYRPSVNGRIPILGGS